MNKARIGRQVFKKEEQQHSFTSLSPTPSGIYPFIWFDFLLRRLTDCSMTSNPVGEEGNNTKKTFKVVDNSISHTGSIAMSISGIQISLRWWHAIWLEYHPTAFLPTKPTNLIVIIERDRHNNRLERLVLYWCVCLFHRCPRASTRFKPTPTSRLDYFSTNVNIEFQPESRSLFKESSPVRAKGIKRRVLEQKKERERESRRCALSWSHRHSFSKIPSQYV